MHETIIVCCQYKSPASLTIVHRIVSFGIFVFHHKHLAIDILKNKT